MGRVASRMAVTGKWLFPLPFENALSRLPGGLAGTLVIAEGRLTAVIECPGDKAAAEVDVRYLLQKMAPGANCDIRFEPLPRDPRHNSKIDYGQLKQQLVMA